MNDVPTNCAIATIFDSYGGKIKSFQNSAFSHREALHSVQYYCQWANDSAENNNIQAVDRVHATMSEHFGSHAYINYCDLAINNWEEAYYGNNFQRLLDIKRSYDPNGLFNYGSQSLATKL